MPHDPRPDQPHWQYKADNGFLDEFLWDDLYTSCSKVDVDIVNGKTRGITYDDLSDYAKLLLGSPPAGAGYYKDSRLYTAAYDAEIKYADWQVGRLLAALKEYDLFDNSLVVVLSDHGEDMTDHKPYFAHAENLYQSLLHVPLMIKFPKQTSRVNVEDHVRTIDLFPTLFDYVGLKTGSSTDGKSLIPALSGQEVDYEERPVISYVEYEGQGKSVSLIKDGYKFLMIIRDDKKYYKLFNLESDPGETNNIAKQKDSYSRIQSFKEYLSNYYSFE
ncbi:MAG: sulfatase-like hydrolase/transferase [Thermodesulfovibrionales bacterium]